jgi:hypothetical protein
LALIDNIEKTTSNLKASEIDEDIIEQQIKKILIE